MFLVKGMEIPTCYNCFARGGNYCRLLRENESVKQYVETYDTSPYCPLVEIKKPHGRLIDADEYEKHLASIASTFARSDAQKSLMGRAMFCLENAPTIIEAEEE